MSEKLILLFTYGFFLPHNKKHSHQQNEYIYFATTFVTSIMERRIKVEGGWQKTYSRISYSLFAKVFSLPGKFRSDIDMPIGEQ